ncbi:RNA-binding region-containing protein 3-like [Glandiceps talaboti]
MNEDKESDILLVRHLPSILNTSEKEELLKHFGASDVHCMCDRGPMKYCAIVKFDDSVTASKALQRLHQLKVLDQRLVVEYANKLPKYLQNTSKIDVKNEITEKEKGKEKKETVMSLSDHVKERSQQFTGIAPSLRISYSSSPHLKYHYPPPCRETLINIIHTLSSVPKFYMQVLHLMNKMNLPAPFGPVTAEPPLTASHTGYQGEDEIYQAEMQISSSEEESELESDEEEHKERKKEQVTVKRPHPLTKCRPRKKPKLHQLLQPVKAVPGPVGSSTTYLTSEVFETLQQQQQQPKKMEFKLTECLSGIQQTTTGRQTASLQQPQQKDNFTEKIKSGFGKINPVTVEEESMEEEEEDIQEEEPSTEFICDKELRKHRMSSKERLKLSAFKNYDPGERNTRLYVKNVSKQADEKDLKYIFGRYVDFTSELEKDMFDVRLMKDGRMKGQAFIGLPSEQKAQSAVNDTNGYLLHGKPIVVQFARSAKPKDKDKENEAKKKQ